MLVQALLIAVAVGGFTFFLFRWLQLRSGYKSMSTVEQRYAEITETVEDRSRKDNSLPAKVKRTFTSAGLGDDLFPLFAVTAFAYLAIVFVLRLLGLDDLTAVLIALPIGAVFAWTANRIVAKRRIRAFNVQMVSLLELVAGQVRGGAGVERALMLVVPGLPDPIRTEMLKALSAGSSGGDLIAALAEIGQRYPSRAFAMFLSALEIDRREGHSIGPALSQAAALMKDSLALQSEGAAEIASTRWEFYAVFGIIMLICVNMVFNNDSARDIWVTPLGVLVLVIVGANSVFGLVRFNRILARIEKETT